MVTPISLPNRTEAHTQNIFCSSENNLTLHMLSLNWFLSACIGQPHYILLQQLHKIILPKCKDDIFTFDNSSHWRWNHEVPKLVPNLLWAHGSSLPRDLGSWWMPTCPDLPQGALRFQHLSNVNRKCFVRSWLIALFQIWKKVDLK